jgi:hypothetical protein
MAPRQISTTSNLRRFANRASRTNLSIAQKQMAPTTMIIKTPIRTDIMAFPQFISPSLSVPDAHLKQSHFGLVKIAHSLFADGRGQRTTLTLMESSVTGLVRSVNEDGSGTLKRWIVTVVAK